MEQEEEKAEQVVVMKEQQGKQEEEQQGKEEEMEVEEQGQVTVAVVKEVEEDEKVYPPPLHSHEDVIRDRLAFMESLRRFHSAMNTKFMIPVIGGKELDLHLLYAEVTQRGGLAKVIEEKKWREVIAAFKFPPTTTSASFVLRRYYLSLLHHYEQVYFFRTRGGLIPPAASSQTRAPPCRLEHSVVVCDSTMRTPKSRKRPSDEPQNRGPHNFTVTGSIDGKFEYGYMVTVKIGNETLRGVLYHVQQQPSPAASNLASATPESSSVPGAGMARTRRRRRKGWRRRDPAHPKPNRSAYNFFFAEKHSKLKALYPHREREFSKMIGESWSKLSEEERTVYQDCGSKDKERYKREMQEYKERLKLAQLEEAAKMEPSKVLTVEEAK
ncbi:high mobility group B protein 9-like [Zingiber officinale]|uniref:high mobility group B protein 9-like n=1 Tax=Zingiber officinale TaxID=94328 RepID=UPI001C4C8548|nr:high mobility group B protein 9-like [Zingiber officinale]